MRTRSRTHFHCLSTKNLMFICMADQSLRKMRAFKFLEEIKERFCREYTPERINQAIAGGLPFSNVLRERMVLEGGID